MAHAVDCNARLVESGEQSPIRSASVAMDRLVRIYGKDPVSTVGTLLSEGAELVRPLVTSEALPVVVAQGTWHRAARYDNSGAPCAGARWDRRNLTYV